MLIGMLAKARSMRLPRAAISTTAGTVFAGSWEQLMANIEADERSRNSQTAEGLLERSWQTIGTDKKMLIALVEFSDVAGTVVDVATANQRATDVVYHNFAEPKDHSSRHGCFQ